MAAICFTSAKLQNSNKKGIIKASEEGYYKVVLGGLNIYNSMGEYYTAQGARALFDKSSDLMRCITNGNLKGENGHPKPRPGEKEDEYMRRAMIVEETNVSHHILSVELDENFGRNNPEYKNPDIIGIIGTIRPSGPHGPALRDALENRFENVNFSIRSLTYNKLMGGRTVKTLEYIRTWDWVTEPGLNVANKYASPALESFVDVALSEKLLRTIISSKGGALSFESANTMATVALNKIEHEKKIAAATKSPIWTGW